MLGSCPLLDSYVANGGGLRVGGLSPALTVAAFINLEYDNNYNIYCPVEGNLL